MNSRLRIWVDRIAGLLVFLCVLALSLSGLRLLRFNYPDMPSWLPFHIGRTSFDTPVISNHLTFAAIFIFAVSLYAYSKILGGRGKELFSFQGRLSPLKAISVIFFALTAIGLTISGLGLYRGWPGAFGIDRFYHQMHHGSMAFMVLSVIGLLILIYKESRQTINRSEFKSRTYVLSILGAGAIALGLVWAFETELNEPRRLLSKEINRSIYVDGIIRPIEWLGGGEVTFFVAGREVVVQAIHDRQTAYLAIKWADSTRSANRKLIKSESGWIEQKTHKVDDFGERVFFEDKLAVSLSLSEDGCVGSCHLRTDYPSGFHASSSRIIDLWSWESVSTNIAREADDGWISLKSSETDNGIRKDNDVASGAYLNLNREWQEPYFLPIRAVEKDAIWIGTGMAMPYRVEQDTFKVGDQIPAILVESLVGDRGDVTAFGRWSDGYWELELARRRRTGSPHDLNLSDTLYLNLAIFDNAEKIHDAQLLPIRLIFE